MEGSLTDFIRALVEELMLREEFDAEAIRGALAALGADLRSLQQDYQRPAPSGAEAVRELMLEGLALYGSATGHILEFLDDLDDEHLLAAVAQADEAQDVLLAVEDLIQINKQVLSEMVSA